VRSVGVFGAFCFDGARMGMERVFTSMDSADFVAFGPHDRTDRTMHFELSTTGYAISKMHVSISSFSFLDPIRVLSVGHAIL